MRLAIAPTAGTVVYVTVSAARSPQEEQDDAGRGDSVLVSTDSASFTRSVTRDGATQLVRNRSVVLTFTAANWNVAQNVYVAAGNDALAEGRRTVAVSHSVQAVITGAGDAAAQAATIAAYNGV